MSDLNDDELDLSALDREMGVVDASARTIRNLQRRLHEEKAKQRELAAVVFEAIEQNAQAMQVRPVRPPASNAKKNRKAEVSVAMMGDNQHGKITPTYNSTMSRDRTLLFGDKVLELNEFYSRSTPISEQRAWLLGDHVEGEDIFPGQAHLIDSSVFEQTWEIAETFIEVFRKWLTVVPKVTVEAVPGNHGNVGRKGAFSDVTNFDRMVFKIIDIAMAQEPRFTIRYPEPTREEGEGGWYWLSRIGGLRTLLMHGYQFRGALGIPWYGVRKKVLGWKALGTDPMIPFPDFDDIAFGHWHQTVHWRINGLGVRGNGTTESWNDYAAQNLASMGRPSQRLMYVAPGPGIVTAEYPEVWLDDGEPIPEVKWDTLAAQAPDESEELKAEMEE